MKISCECVFVDGKRIDNVTALQITCCPDSENPNDNKATIYYTAESGKTRTLSVELEGISFGKGN